MWMVTTLSPIAIVSVGCFGSCFKVPKFNNSTVPLAFCVQCIRWSCSLAVLTLIIWTTCFNTDEWMRPRRSNLVAQCHFVPEHLPLSTATVYHRSTELTHSPWEVPWWWSGRWCFHLAMCRPRASSAKCSPGTASDLPSQHGEGEDKNYPRSALSAQQPEMMGRWDTDNSHTCHPRIDAVSCSMYPTATWAVSLSHCHFMLYLFSRIT